jgi:hypothetical protein
VIIDIHLGHNAEHTLSYELYDNDVARLFHKRLHDQENKVVSRTQFYNFGETEESVQAELMAVTERLQELGIVQDASLQTLNNLHENFPNAHDESEGEVRELLRMFNYHIHHLEDIRRKHYNGSRFIFACEDAGTDIPAEALDMFTVRRRYGELYMHYPHVGKHLLEVFADNDVNVPADHLICTNVMRNTLCGWFGEDRFTTTIEQENLMMSLFMFYRQIMHKIPYQWKDPKLAIGYLPLGMLIDLEQDINIINDNKYIHSWSCR